MQLFREQLLLFCHRKMHKKFTAKKWNSIRSSFLVQAFSSALLLLGAVLEAFKKASLRLLGQAAGASSTVL